MHYIITLIANLLVINIIHAPEEKLIFQALSNHTEKKVQTFDFYK